MWVAVLAGLLVSIDALFIGVSFGTQKKCKFWHVVIINMVLIALCIAGYFLGMLIGDSIDFAIDLVIGPLFIVLGLWVILSYFLFKEKHQAKSIAMTGAFMSIEAMFITIGLTLTLEVTTILIPITVGLAHLIYSAVTFCCAKYMRKFPPMAGHIISGVALIIYGILALVL